MPIYEFECDECHRRVEVLTSFSNAETIDGIPHCGIQKLDEEICEGIVRLVPSLPRFNLEFPSQAGGVHSMAGFGKRSRNRQGD